MRSRMTKNEAEFVSVQGAAEILSVSPKLIYALINRGELRAFKVGRLLRVRRADLFAAIGAEVAA